jgi:hypothetical protein
VICIQEAALVFYLVFYVSLVCVCTTSLLIAKIIIIAPCLRVFIVFNYGMVASVKGLSVLRINKECACAGQRLLQGTNPFCCLK